MKKQDKYAKYFGVKTLGVLTLGNMSKVSTVINKDFPEWGVKRFDCNGQPLNDGDFAHVVGSGAVMFYDEMKNWEIVSFK